MRARPGLIALILFDIACTVIFVIILMHAVCSADTTMATFASAWILIILGMPLANYLDERKRGDR